MKTDMFLTMQRKDKIPGARCQRGKEGEEGLPWMGGESSMNSKR